MAEQHNAPPAARGRCPLDPRQGHDAPAPAFVQFFCCAKNLNEGEASLHATGREYSLVPARPEHIPHLAANMRGADRREVLASHGASPMEALRQSLAASTSAWCALEAGRPFAMWGVGAPRTALAETGSPWLLATPALYRHSRAFLRLSRFYVELMHRDFPVLENYVHAKNRASLRWLAWCGFSLAPRPAPYGLFKQPFYRFWRIKCAM